MQDSFRAALRRVCHRIFFLCQKELLVTLQDKRMRFVLVVPALMQGLLFGYSASYNLENVPYAIVDCDHSAASRDLLAHIEGATAFSCQAVLANPTQLDEVLESGDVILGVVIPPDFARRLSRGEAAPVQAITDGRNSSIAGLANGYLSSIVSSWNEARGAPGPVSVVCRTWYNPNQTSRWTFLPSIMASIAFVQVLLLAGLSIAKEREQGTFDQLLVTPLTPGEILVGKALTPLLVGLLQSLIIFCLGRFWFDIPFAGSLVVLLGTILLFNLSTIGVGLALSAVARNMQQVMVYLLVLIMPMVLLSGLATPVSNMPRALQLLTYADPMRFAVAAVRRIYLEGAGPGQLLYCYVPLVAIAAVTLPFAGWLFTRQTD